MDPVAPIVELAKFVHKETSIPFEGGRGCRRRLTYLETSQETFDVLLSLHAKQKIILEGREIRIIKCSHPTLDSFYFAKFNTIVGHISWNYFVYFVINSSLPKGKVILKQIYKDK